MIRSFRLRLALLSALLTGVVLLLFGAGSWWLIRDSKLQRLDTELRAYAEREVNRERSAEEWQAEELRITNALGLRDTRDVVLLLQTDAGDTVYQSSHWPATWSPAALPWPTSRLPAGKTSSTLSIFSEAVAAEIPGNGDVMLAQAGERPGPRGGGGPGGPGGMRPPPGGPLHRPPPLQQPPLQDSPLKDSPSQDPPLRDPPLREPPVPPDVRMEVPVQPALPAPVAPADTKPGRGPAPGPGPVVVVLQRMVDGNPWRMALARIDVAHMAIAVNAQAIEADMRGIRNAFLLSLPLALLLTGLASWVFASRALKPIDKLAKATRSVTAGGLDQRIAVQGDDREFVELIEVFNRMLGRLERSFKQAHRFTADAAHELKTPLAIVQGQLERTIHQAGDGSQMQAMLSSILDEVRRLSVISRKLLLLSQADAGHLTVMREAVDLSKVLEELLEDSRMLAPHLTIEADIQSGLLIQADGSLLRQVLHNLISNAIKYNVDGGWIRIGCMRWSGSVEVLVSNASTGITNANRARLFERFFRADQAHSRTVEGVGLGLSVSREIARAHGGDLTLKGETAGSVQFALVLPL